MAVVQVRVYLRSMEGLPAFTEVWNSWVDRDYLPVSDVAACGDWAGVCCVCCS